MRNTYELIHQNPQVSRLQQEHETLKLRLMNLKKTHFTVGKKTALTVAEKLYAARNEAGEFGMGIAMVLYPATLVPVLMKVLNLPGLALFLSASVLPVALLYGAKVYRAIREGRVYTHVYDTIFQRIGAQRALKDYLTYAQIIKDKEVFSVSALASAAEQSVRKVVKRLRKMEKMHLLPEHTLDEQEGMIYLTDKARREYLTALENNKREEKLLACDNHETLAVFVKKIRQHNDILPDKEISDALDVTENLLQRIIVEIEKDPSVDGKLRRTASYYLPQIDSLLNDYYDLFVNKKDFARTKEILRDIVGGVTMLNGALRRILEEILMETAMRVDTDLKVMKIMLEQEGIVG